MRLVYPFSDHVTHTPTPIQQGVAMAAVEHGTVRLYSWLVPKWSLGGCASLTGSLFFLAPAERRACASL